MSITVFNIFLFHESFSEIIRRGVTDKVLLTLILVKNKPPLKIYKIFEKQWFRLKRMSKTTIDLTT